MGGGRREEVRGGERREEGGIMDLFCFQPKSLSESGMLCGAAAMTTVWLDPPGLGMRRQGVIMQMDNNIIYTIILFIQ